MSDLIDREKAINIVNTMTERCTTNDIHDLHDLIVESLAVLPSVGAVEVVWCKDCKHFIKHGFPWGMCEVRGCTALLDDYCFQAKRRTDDNGLD